MKMRGVLGGAVILLALAGGAWARGAPDGRLGERLAELVESGELDPSRAHLYRLYAVVAADRLPGHLQAAPAAARANRGEADRLGQMPGVRCGTPILRAVRARLDAMSPADRAEAEALLDPARPPAARTASQVGGKTVTHLLPNWVVTQNFSIEWGPGLTNEDGSTPVRDLDGDGVPDVVERWAELFEASHAAETAVLHPSDPGSVFAGTGAATALIPVYIGNSSPTSTVEDISSGTYAFTQEAAPTPYVVVNNDLRFVPANDAGAAAADRIRGAMKITAAHELFHVVHFLYEPKGLWVPTEDDWWLETSATWMEDEVFDSVNDYHQYFGATGWTSFVEAGLAVPFGDPNYVTRAYGGAIFAKYLSEHVGGRAMMGELWDLIRPAPAPGRRVLDALGTYAASRGLTDVGTLFLGFAAANAVMDYEEGAAYRHSQTAAAVPVRNTGSLSHTETLPNRVPDYLGATYLRRTTGLPGPVTVSLAGAPAVRWGLSLMAKRAGGYGVALGADGVSGGASLSLSNLGPLDELYAVPALLSPPPAASTSYSTTESSLPALDTTAPGAPTGLAAVAAAGGFDASWVPPADPDVSGYVVRWRPSGALEGSGRTVVAPLQAMEVRGLGAGSYEVEVFAYDAFGNADPAAAAAVSVTVAQPGSDSPIPPSQTVIVEVRQGAEPPPGDAGAGGGGGGGGGGCFVDSLFR